jgi:murein DD-endopeptidase MepM/ murein hydrolase activator NlpD
VRRLAQHAVAGAGFAAVVTAISVVGLNSPAVDDVATAVPAPVTSAAAAPDPSAERVREDAELRLAVQQARRSDAAAVKAERARVKAAKQAAKRSTLLRKRTKAISSEHVKLVAAAKKAAKEAAERKRALANRGYLPGTTDPREIARQILKNKFDYGEADFDCFNNIIIRESMWDIDATNPSSGAYGIPQALPGSKMASAGSDWRTNPATQIIWAVGYMEDRYGSPCAAWTFKRANGWY